MKIAMLVPGGVDRSGTDRVIPALLWLIERVARRHDLHVFALWQEPSPARWELLGAQVHNIGTARGRRRRVFSALLAEHRRAPFDLLHAFWGGVGMYASLASSWLCVPLLLHLAGGELVAIPDASYGDQLTLRGRLSLRLAVAGARCVTVASAPLLRLAEERGMVAELVPLGVALDRWPVAAPRRRDPMRPARLLHIGDLRPVKDQSTLLLAIARLHAAGIALHLDVAGYDTMNGAMQRLSTQLRIEALVQWHGVLRRDPLRALVDSADVLLVTSRHEAGPMAVREAAVAGVPTVGTAVGHVAEWAPLAAVAVPPHDPHALARETEALLRDEPRRLSIAREAQRQAVAHDADYTAERFEQLYRAHARPSR